MFVAIVATVLFTLTWIAFLALLRKHVFKPGHNKYIGGALCEEVRRRLSEERMAHSDKVYKDFEFFYKTSLAIAGGVIYILLEYPRDILPARRELLAMDGGNLIIAASFVFMFFIGNHVYSTIRRYEHKYNLIEVLHWQETGALAAMIFFPFYFRFGLIPELLTR